MKKGPNKIKKRILHYELILEDKWRKERARAKVDKKDYNKVKKYRWCLRSEEDRYAVTNVGGKIFHMHRLILGLEKYDKFKVVDHINQDRLNNRRKNLRIVTRSINAHNSKKAKGYYFDKRRKSFVVEFMVNGYRTRIFGVETEEKAIKIRKQLELNLDKKYGYNISRRRPPSTRKPRLC